MLPLSKNYQTFPAKMFTNCCLPYIDYIKYGEGDLYDMGQLNLLCLLSQKENI